MSAYLITREGQELGSFEIAQIHDGLKSGVLQASDWGWREGMDGWKGLAEIVGPAAASQVKSMASPSTAPARKTESLKPVDLNPYAAPSANVVQGAASGAVPYAVIDELKGTKPWVRLVSVVMWTGCVVFIFVVIGLFISGLSRGSGAYALGTAFGYGIFSLLIIYPTLKLSKYASNIAKLVESHSFADLTAALAEQRRFWKFYGILLLIYVGIFGLIFIGSMFFSSRF